MIIYLLFVLKNRNESDSKTQSSKTDGDESTNNTKSYTIPQYSSSFPDIEGVSGRLLFFGTTTTTSVTTVTYTNYLTAVCLSSTPWTTCDKE